MDVLIQQEIMLLLQRGKLDQAITRAKDVCESEHQDSESWLLLASIYSMRGDIEKVRDCCLKALALDANSLPANYNLAIAFENLGDLHQAVKHYKKFVALSPESIDVYCKLGDLLHRLIDFNGACSQFRAALAINNNRIDAMTGLAKALLGLDRYDEAIDYYLRVLKVNPDLPEIIFNLGTAYYKNGNNNSAIGCFQKVIEKVPDSASTYNSLGLALYEEKNFSQAIIAYKKAIELRNEAAVHTNLGNVYNEMGSIYKAMDCHERAIQLNPDYEPALYNMSNLCVSIGELERAEACINRAIKLSPERIDTIVGKAVILEKKGEVEEAFNLLRPLAEKNVMETNFILAYALLEVKRTESESKEIIDLLENALMSGHRLFKEYASIHFALGDKYNELGDYGSAFENYENANNYIYTPITMTGHVKHINDVISFFKNMDLSSSQVSSNPAGTVPIFIIGMPRSGTSLVEQILSTNENVFGAGELFDLQELIESVPDRFHITGDYLQCFGNLNNEQLEELSGSYINVLNKLSSSEKYVVDKMPFNYVYLGIIAILFPSAKIIHCTRDAVDICLSCYFNNFIGNPYFRDLVSIGKYYNNYSKLMDFWNSMLQTSILEVRYEELVENPVSISQDIMQFCDIEWNASCLDFYKNKRISYTASYNQVRKPIYKKSLRRGEKYAPYIKELLQALKMH